ncbi:MAG: ABC transporter ATP-binding protein [Bacteroidaceae bacterium]|nr:ABC transporter ATP-binding protein [Bacteroidaceae bacterium]
MKQPTIQIESLSTGYRSKNNVTIVAHDINATIHGGELTCLLGPNGAGKSTLLRTLSAFLPPVKGNITIMGRNLRDYSDRELSKTIGVVLTEKTDLRNMTVEDLIGLGRSPYTGFWGTLHQHDRDIVAKAIEMVGIEPLKDRMIHTLSDGERQKVMIAKALAQETPVIFLDEPTAFLDFPSKVEIMQLLHTLSRTTGKTIFLSTHDLELALQIADTIWLMDRQKGVMIGTPDELATNGSLNSFFTQRGIEFQIHNVDGSLCIIPKTKKLATGNIV